MEVGAVKQAFNNEVILLKKKLNQAKIQIIHKLTRKAKTFTEKKAPDHLKEKLRRKAESAVNEVLICKKIKARDIAKFIITHTGKLSDYINRPKVDNDKACARLVLHKSLQDKYTFIRNRFGNIPIKDLFMSRQERRKLKKEAKEQQKNKKKGRKDKVTNSAGDWDVEDVEMGDEDVSKKIIVETDMGQSQIGSDDEVSGDENENSDENIRKSDDNDSDIDKKYVEMRDDINKQRIVKTDISQSEIGSDDEVSGDENEYSEENITNLDDNSDIENSDENDSNLPTNHERSDEEVEKSDESANKIENDSNNECEDEEVGTLMKLTPEKVKAVNHKLPKSSIDKIKIDFDAFVNQKQLTTVKGNKTDKNVKENKTNKKVKEGKNKNLKEKLQTRKFKKVGDDDHTEGRKVVDPFFITATGGNYLSLAEPRQPDEIKEVHKQGNRQERRAAMFGRKFKPRNDFKNNSFRSNKFDEGNNRNSGGRNRNDRLSGEDFNDRNSKFNERNGKFDEGNGKFNERNGTFNDGNGKFNDRNAKFNDRNTDFNNRNSKFNDKNDRFMSKNINNVRNENKKEEKLHPSWEAKRKLKSMSLLPSQGKKIVFDN